MNIILRLLTVALVLVGFCIPATGQEATLPTGRYKAEVTLGPVHLAGQYRCFLADVDSGFISVNTSPDGSLTGSITLLGRTEDFTGNLRSRSRGVRLMLRGRTDEGSIVLKAALVGDEFVGTATIRGKKAPCRIDLSGVGALKAIYDVSLESQSNGTFAGNGTLKIGQTEVLVVARGRTKRGKVALAIRQGKKFVLRTSTGQLNSEGITTGKWIAEGFGALAKGSSLQVARVSVGQTSR